MPYWYPIPFVILPYSIPCWLVGAGIYYLGGVYRTDYSGDDFLILVVTAPISLPALVWLKLNGT